MQIKEMDVRSMDISGEIASAAISDILAER
jgi:hypothetical protein